MPRESDHERTVRHRLTDLLAGTPIPPEELVDNLALYLRGQPLTDLLSLDALYRVALNVPGVIMEFGVHRRRHLAVLTALRGVHEPYNPHRRIIGFDNFTGFPDVTDIDTTSPVPSPAGSRSRTATHTTCATYSTPTSRANTSATSGAP